MEYKPGFWLFPGQNPDKPLSRRTLQNVFREDRINAGISKKCYHTYLETLPCYSFAWF